MIEELVKKSRCYRRFDQSYKVKVETLKKVVECLRYISSAKNLQPLKYIASVNPKKNNEIFSTLKWAGYLKDWDGPMDGERPTAYLIILKDKTISDDLYVLTDAGIAIQTAMIVLTEMGLGGCPIAAIDKVKLSSILKLHKYLEILYVIAIGKPAERVIITDAQDSHIEYFRDSSGNHYVPKRRMEELLLTLYT